MICFHIMKFEIQNVARVREASISLDGVTVIVGMNGSGKSSIAKGAVALRYLVRKMPSLLLWERAWSLIRHFVELCPPSPRTLRFSLQSPWDIAFRILMGRREDVLTPDQLVVASFWEDPKQVCDYFMQYLYANRAGNITPDPQMMTEFSETYAKCIAEMVQFLENQKDRNYVRTIAGRVIQECFRGQVAPLGGTEESPCLRLEGEGVSARAEVLSGGRCATTGLMEGRVSGTHYLETRHLLDDVCDDHDFYGESPFGGGLEPRGVNQMDQTWATYLARRREETPTPEQVAEERNRRAKLEQVSALIHGRLGHDKSGFYFHDEEVRGHIRIPNIASGMKSMAVIAKAVENGWIRPGDLLVIDEPESNLHPEWQVEFAQWLVALSNELDIRLLLNTHSPYFLRATELGCQNSKTEERLHVYRMEPELNDAGIWTAFFKAKDVTHDIASAYSDMARPFDQLMRG